MIKYIKYNDTLDYLAIGDGFFEGWERYPSKKTHRKILKESYLSIVAVENSTIIGFINCISDGILSAYIPLLEVLPEYRNKGIGKNLVNKLLEELGKIYMIDVFCDDDVVRFYEECKMTKYGNAMLIRNYENQEGKLNRI